MTLAEIGPVSSNFIVTGFALCALFAFVIGAIVWKREGQLDDHDDELAQNGNTIAAHTEQLATLAYQMPALLEWLGIEIPAPVQDDSPEALEADEEVDPSTVTIDLPPNPTKRTIATVPYPDDAPTDEFPVAPATVPDGLPLAVQTALIEQRPSPVPRDLSDEFPHPVDSDERKAKNAADIDERLKRFDFSGRDR